MIITDQQYGITRARLAEFQATLAALKGSTDPAWRHLEVAAVSSQIETFERELAMWEAGIHEPVPDMPRPADLELPAGVDARTGVIALKQAEITTIDHQIGVLLDRIADWRRHRAWLEREIATLEAEVTERQPQHSHAR
jgi:hypothetical protein